jgi:hypothetical protein
MKLKNELTRVAQDVENDIIRSLIAPEERITHELKSNTLSAHHGSLNRELREALYTRKKRQRIYFPVLQDNPHAFLTSEYPLLPSFEGPIRVEPTDMGIAFLVENEGDFEMLCEKVFGEEKNEWFTFTKTQKKEQELSLLLPTNTTELREKRYKIIYTACP